MTVVTQRPFTCEAIQFTGDNLHEVRKFVEFTGHTFRKGPHPFSPGQQEIFWLDLQPGIILTVVRGEWLVYNLSDAKWRVFSDKEFGRQFQ